MATNDPSGRGRGSRSRNRGNNNPEGRNQYTGAVRAARGSPIAAAVAVGGIAAAAGLFLWSRRNQISDQIGNLADQISEWRDGMTQDNDGAEQTASGENFITRSGSTGRSQAEISEEALSLKEIGKVLT